MASVNKQPVTGYVYELTLSQHEMEVLYIILGDSDSLSVLERAKDYGVTVDEDGDSETSYELYDTVREALGRDDSSIKPIWK